VYSTSIRGLDEYKTLNKRKRECEAGNQMTTDREPKVMRWRERVRKQDKYNKKGRQGSVIKRTDDKVRQELPRLQARQHKAVVRLDEQIEVGKRYRVSGLEKVIARPTRRFRCCCHGCGQSRDLSQIQSVGTYAKHTVIQGTHS